MFSSFRHNRPDRQLAKNDAQNNMAARIARKLKKIQEQCAVLIQHQTKRLSFRVKMFLFIIFLLLSAGYSIYLIAGSLMSDRVNASWIGPTKIFKNIGKSSSENTQHFFVVTTADYQKIQKFHKYIDSIAKTTAGKKIRDSFLQLRPGLMDSIYFIENISQLQSNKK